MQRVKTSTAVSNLAAYIESGTPGYFTAGDAVAGTPATVPGAQWFNQVQEELLNVIKAANITPDATKDNQLAAAIAALIAAQAVTVEEASETVAGILKLATQAMVNTGTDDTAAVTALKLATYLASRIGTTAGKLLALDANGKLPAVPGDLLTSLPAAVIKADLNASGDAPIYAARAWVNFNGTGTPAIKAGGNVSSVTKLSTGSYQVSMTTAMPDANYAFMVDIGATANGGTTSHLTSGVGTKTASTFFLYVFTSGFSVIDEDEIMAVVHR